MHCLNFRHTQISPRAANELAAVVFLAAVLPFVFWLTIASSKGRVDAIRVASIWALVESGFELLQLGNPDMTARTAGAAQASLMTDLAQMLTA